MRKKQHSFKSTFLIITLLIAAVACKKDKQWIDPNSIATAILFTKNDTLHVPATIAVPNTDSFSFALVGKGYQKYTGTVTIVPGSPIYGWNYTGVQADLYNKNNQKIGTHFSGPNWQVGTDTLKGVNKKEANLIDENNIDWLRFDAMKGGVNIPSGMFKNVTYVQRVLTIGGQPTSLRNPGPADVNQVDSVAYMAVYRFNIKK